MNVNTACEIFRLVFFFFFCLFDHREIYLDFLFTFLKNSADSVNPIPILNFAFGFETSSNCS